MNEETSVAGRVEKCLKSVRTVHQPLTSETLFKKDLGFESIDVVDLLFELEQEFKVSFHMRDFSQYVLKFSRVMNWDFNFELLCQFVTQTIKT